MATAWRSASSSLQMRAASMMGIVSSSVEMLDLKVKVLPFCRVTWRTDSSALVSTRVVWDIVSLL